MKKYIILFSLFLLGIGIGLAISNIHNLVQHYSNVQTNTMIENAIDEHTANVTTNKINFDALIAEEKEKTYSLPENSVIHTLKAQHLPIIIYFGADYCPKCVEMEPIFESIKQKTQGKAIIEYIDKVKQKEIAEQYPIRLIPTQIFVNADGTPYDGEKASEKPFVKYYDAQGNHTLTTVIGTMTEETIMEILKEMGMEE